MSSDLAANGSDAPGRRDAAQPTGRGPRFASVDALRGLTVAAMLLVNDAGDWHHVYAPLEHAAWHGCTPTDLVFPWFLLWAGVSLTLGPVAALERAAPGDAVALGDARRHAVRALAWRALRIVLLGLALHAVAHWALDTRAFRPMGVLQRIGLCVGFAGWLALRTRPRTQWLVFGLLLLGYAALLWLGGPLTKDGNVAGRVDTAVLGPLAYQFNAVTGRAHEPEGLLSTLPAVATTLLGVRAGDWLRRRRRAPLLAAGLACAALGAVFAAWLPLNKQLWTPTFVLWTGGWGLLALALAHTLVDRRGWPPLGRSLGRNAVAVYAAAWLTTCLLGATGWGAALYRQAFGWMVPSVGPYLPSLAYAVCFVAVFAAAARALAVRGVQIRI